jgi:hypothetical protein
MTDMEKRCLRTEFQVSNGSTFIMCHVLGELGGQQAYRFSGDAFEIFENFFGTGNPHTIAIDGKYLTAAALISL